MNYKTDLLINLAPRIPSLCFIESEMTPVEPPAEVTAPVAGEEPELDLGDDDTAPLTPEEKYFLDIGSDKIEVDKRVKEYSDGLQRSAQEKSETVNKRLQELATQETQIAERARVFQSVQAQIVEIHGIDTQIAPYEKLTHQEWIAWGSQDAEAANRALTAVNALKFRRQQLTGIVESTIKETQAKEALAASTRAALADSAISAKFKDWSPAKRDSLVKTAVEYGFQAAELTDAYHDPRVLSVVQDAMKYRAAVAKAASKAKGGQQSVAEQIAAAPAPGTAVRGNAGGKPTNDLSDKVTDSSQWAKNFSKALRKRG